MPSVKSESFFSAKELFSDKAFVISLIATVSAAAATLSGIALFAYNDRIVIRPIAQVVNVEDSSTRALKPISEIIKLEGKDSKSTAWAGWAIRLSDLCEVKGGSFSKGFSDDFQNGNAKLIIPADSPGSWTVANAKLTGNTCYILKDEKEAHGIYAVFDSKISSLADKQTKAVFVPKTDATNPGFWAIP